MRTYNERIADVAQDDTGMPTAWTWRNRRYTAVGERPVEFWIITTDWWLEPEPLADAVNHIPLAPGRLQRPQPVR